MEPYDLVDAAAARLSRSQLQPDGSGGVLWLEQRPDLEGRTILMRRDASGGVFHVGDERWSISSSIGGYGGRAYLVSTDGIYVVLAKSHEVWFLPELGDPRQVFVPPTGWAIGDLVLTTRGLTAICEVHGETVERSVVAISPSGELEVLFQGPHFLMDLRASRDGTQVGFVHWEHPHMPWDAGTVALALVPHVGRLLVEQEFGGLSAPSWAPRFSETGVFSFQQTIDNWITPVILGGTEVTAFGNSCDFAEVPWTSTENAHLVRRNGDLIAVARREGIHQLMRLSSGEHVRDSSVVSIVDLCETDGTVMVLGATHEDRPSLFCLDDETLTLHPVLPSVSRMVTRMRPHGVVGADGRRIEGFVALPEGVNQPPLIVFCHGGPTGQVDSSFDPAVQVFCSRGYAVAAPNYRGSTGFGRAYRAALDGNWGIVDVLDVVEFTEGLIAQGLVDAKAVFIRGGSAGGFTALRALESGLFLGATGNYACTDLLQLAKVTHDFELHYLDTLLGPLSTHEALYAERSPINHPEHLHGGVLLLQGGDDVVVPASQTEQFVKRCQDLGLDVDARVFPGEGHGFRRAATLIEAWRSELSHYESLLSRRSSAR